MCIKLIAVKNKSRQQLCLESDTNHTSTTYYTRHVSLLDNFGLKIP